jgi:hypothetical protein
MLVLFQEIMGELYCELGDDVKGAVKCAGGKKEK